MIYTASWEEILWVLLTCVALVYSWINYRASVAGVQRIIDEHVNGRFLRTARGFRRNDAGRALKQVGFLVIGLSAVLNLPYSRIIFLVVMFAMQTWLVWGAVLDKRDREWLQEHPRDEHDDDPLHDPPRGYEEWDKFDVSPALVDAANKAAEEDAAGIITEAIEADEKGEREGEG